MSTSRALVVFVALSSAGCPGSLENPEQFLGECFDPPTDLFPQSCALTDCHVAGEAPAVDEAQILKDRSGGGGGRGIGRGFFREERVDDLRLVAHLDSADDPPPAVVEAGDLGERGLAAVGVGEAHGMLVAEGPSA